MIWIAYYEFLNYILLNLSVLICIPDYYLANNMILNFPSYLSLSLFYIFDSLYFISVIQFINFTFLTFKTFLIFQFLVYITFYIFICFVNNFI